MISLIPQAPENVAAFIAKGEISKEDFEKIVMPRVKAVVAEYDELNYLLKIDTDLENFTWGAWWQDALLGIKNLANWNRAAIVTDEAGIKIFTAIFSKIMPGEFRAFSKDQLENALRWTTTGAEAEQR